MSDDDRRRNGRDPIVVPLPLDRPRRPAIEAPPRTWRTEYEWQRSMTDTVVQLVPAVNDQTETVAEVHAQTLVLTRAVNRLSELVQEQQPLDPDKSYHEFDPAVAELRREMKRRIAAGDDPFTEQQAVEFMERVVAQLRERREEQSDARKWRTVKKGAWAIAWETFKYFLPSAIVGGAVYLWHWLSLHQ